MGVPFIMGYWARTMKNVAAGQPRPLPSWDDLGGIFSDGLRLLGVYLVYTLGILVAMALVGGVVMVPLIAIGSTDGWTRRGGGASAASASCSSTA